MKYSIGLDIGITSVGYAVMALREDDTPYRIVRLGSRIFDRAEQPKTGASLALPRREARGLRRRLRRHRHRNERIRGLIVSSGILGKEELEHLYDKPVSDIYELRVRALDEAVTPDEFARILINLAQRRGFKSNRKAAEENDKEGGKLLKAVSANESLCAEKHYRTVGEMLYKDEKFAEQKRNKGAAYANTVSRAAVEAEVKLIFKMQREHGNALASEETEEKYLEILLSQRSFAEGPASGPYSGNQIDKMVGKCTLEKTVGNTEEPRAAKATYSFQVFNLWQHINHLRYVVDGNVSALSDGQRKAVFDVAHKTADLSYSKIRKVAELPENAAFIGLRYENGKEEEAERKKINDMKAYHDVRKCLDKVSKTVFPSLTHEQLDVIGEALSKNYSDDDILSILEEAGIEKEAREAIVTLPNFSKYGHISVKACKKLLPFLEKGMAYDKACEAAGYNFKADGKDAFRYLPPLPTDDATVTSPVARRAISQTIKVINAIVREMDESPVYINIELAREMHKNFEDRNEIKKAQDENAANNERIVEILKNEHGVIAPTGQDIIKYKLWQEQDGVCPYSGETIPVETLFSDKDCYCDIDHIVPYSISWDDRLANKVLVLSSENRQKGNRLPLQYLTGDRRDRFIVWVKTNPRYKSGKRQRLLMEKISDEDAMRDRNLKDTQTATAFLNGYIASNLGFAESGSGMRRRVYSINGAVTSYVRKRWGLSKNRADGDAHHAVDAAVVACVTQSMIQRITKYSQYRETRYTEIEDRTVDIRTGEVIEFPYPWDEFRTELDIRLLQDKDNMIRRLEDVNLPNYEEIEFDTLPAFFVSRMANHKVTGAAHKETFRSGRCIASGKTLSKTPLTKLSLKNGEIEGYYNKESDRLLYDALVKRLEEFGGKGEKAFAKPFYKPKADGTPGPVVKSVKIEEKVSSVVDILDHKAVANNDSMARVDVFFVEDDGYYFVPVYVADTVKEKLPDMACVQSKPWKQMEEKNFVFSLYKNDLFKVYSKKQIELAVANKDSSLPPKKTVDGESGVFLYFDGLNISSGVISGITNDSSYYRESIGKKTLLLEKYEVDVLGNVRKVEREIRRSFNGR